MLFYNSGSFDRDGKRPGSHLNLGTLIEIVKDIMAKGAMNDAEQIIISCNGVAAPGQEKAIAQYMKGNNVLSGNDLAVCHKVPYAAIEKCLQTLLNKRNVTHSGWAALKMFWGALYPPHGYANTIHAEWSNLQGLADTLYKAASNTPAETKAATACEVAANNFLREFDACDYNLYVGFQGTNASIGDKIDLHYDINGPGVGPISATPRGTDLFNALNFLETNLGMSKTSAVESVDKKAKITWQKNSGAGSATTIGWVNIA